MRSQNHRVLFVLPVNGGGGGAHSVVQEVQGLRRLGVDARIAIKASHQKHFRRTYPKLNDFEAVFAAFSSKKDLVVKASSFDICVGTVYFSMEFVRDIVESSPYVKPAYYIQDYEPWFYPLDSTSRARAVRSYTLIPEALCFAKTWWLCEKVATEHNVKVHKVTPSIDHRVYFPAERREPGPVRVVWRWCDRAHLVAGPDRTMRVLAKLKGTFGSEIEIHIFGCDSRDVEFRALPVNFEFQNHGVLTRDDVAALLRRGDIFADLSDYQAFGRTALEAMACGTVVAVPELGGANEYAVQKDNAIVVDTRSDDACVGST